VRWAERFLFWCCVVQAIHAALKGAVIWTMIWVFAIYFVDYANRKWGPSV